eukprot:358583-Chlamydomonas_euryale.AAC.1
MERPTWSVQPTPLCTHYYLRVVNFEHALCVGADPPGLFASLPGPSRGVGRTCGCGSHVWVWVTCIRASDACMGVSCKRASRSPTTLRLRCDIWDVQPKRSDVRDVQPKRSNIWDVQPKRSDIWD